MMDEYAVYVKNVNKSYGNNKILNDLCMKVPRGCIYGLLGASGCGKTTLLSGIVGRKKFDSGDVYVMGGRPGTKGSGVPGPRVGYMPQEIALVAEFTIKDAIYYFGRILDMPDSAIAVRLEELKTLLDLPPLDRFLKNCSGGQQRRVSFAAAMVHKPELLILDEPTVGLDPVLRDNIWNYLVKISEEEKVAVIITTHYIEETRQAHRIGLMRNGRLLAEESPTRLMQLFRTDTLEEVFLILSKQQEEGRLNEIGMNLSDDQNNSMVSDGNDLPMSNMNNRKSVFVPTQQNFKTTYSAFSLNKNRLKSLSHKNAMQFFRNTGAIIFTFTFPLLEMFAFLLAVGGDVRDIKLGIVNDEHMKSYCDSYNHENTTMPFSYSSCHLNNLDCRFLDELTDPMIDKVYYDDLDVALEEVTHGNVVGVLHIRNNFTASFEERVNDLSHISDYSLEYSQINVWLDMSNRQIGTSLKFKLLKKYVDFQIALVEDCNLPRKSGEVPLRFEYEYGRETDSFTVFMVPGVLLTIMFFLGTTSSATIIISDRLEGVWDRSIVAGVSSLEIVLTHFLMQFILIVVQVFEIMILTFAMYGIEVSGNLAVVWLMTLLQGLTGMCFGFWVSIVSDTHSAANVVTTGLFYPMIVLCGMIWPLEGQPIVLRTISRCLPFTIPIESLRNVIKKGYGLNKLEVIDGIGVTLAWIVILSVVSVFAIKRKR